MNKLNSNIQSIFIKSKDSFMHSRFINHANMNMGKGLKEYQKKIDEKLDREIEESVDQNTIRLLKNVPSPSVFVLHKKEGQLFTEKKDNGFFSCCFSKTRKTSDVSLINRKLYVRSKDQLKWYVNFDAVTVQLIENQNSFTIRINNRIEANPFVDLYFEQVHKEDMEEWISTIKLALKDSLGVKFKLTYITMIPDFHKKQYIHETEFSQICNSGDILLFQSEHTMAKLQRGITGSEYDHVGIVLKNQKNQIIIFESNSNTGVAFTFWKDMIKFKWYNFIDRIAHRKLQIERDDRTINMMEEFIVKNLDKKFDLGLAKIFTFQSVLQKTQEQENSRTYFCSELVAAFYKHLGLLEREKSCTQYFPVDFSSAKDLPLLKGSLESEQIICFESDIIGDRYK